MHKTILAIAVTLVCATVPVFGQQDTNGDGIVTILLPIAISDNHAVNGAHGSIWKMETWVHNDSDTGIFSFQPAICHLPDCGGPNYLPGFIGRFSASGSNFGYGAILSLIAPIAADVHFSARLLETTRRAQPTGVDLPVVRENQFFSRPSSFIAIPVGPAIRSTLRVYDPRLRPGSSVRADILNDAGALIASRRLSPGNDPVVTEQDPRLIRVAGYDAIIDLTQTFPELQALQKYHIVVTPETPGMEYWAFVSVTDNESQHVLLITSQ